MLCHSLPLRARRDVVDLESSSLLTGVVIKAQKVHTTKSWVQHSQSLLLPPPPPKKLQKMANSRKVTDHLNTIQVLIFFPKGKITD
jgi:hypothetical protein